jgi:hypothetical protein
VANLLEDLNGDQKSMIDIIYMHYATKGKWPTWRYVRRSFAKARPSDPGMVRDSFPVIGDRRVTGPSYSAIWFSPQDLSDDAEHRLCLAAGLQHPRFQVTATRIVEAVRYFAVGMKTVDPDAGPVSITSNQLASEMSWGHLDMINLPDFLSQEPLTLMTGCSIPEGERWKITLGDEGLTPYCDVSTVQDYVSKTVKLVLAMQAEQSASRVSPTVGATTSVVVNNVGYYVDDRLIDQLEGLQHPSWHLGRLTAMLRELNANYAAGHPYSCLVLCRAIIDHIPPIFGFKTFAQVVNMPGVGRSERRLLELLGDNRFTADHVLHHHISKKADIITLHDVPSRTGMNILVQLAMDALV